jgi:hypothetical protein
VADLDVFLSNSARYIDLFAVSTVAVIRCVTCEQRLADPDHRIAVGDVDELKALDLTTMARKAKESAPFKLKQPDRSGRPSDETLLGFAEDAGILNVPQQKSKPEDAEPLIGRLGESVLWSVSLTMLHFTLDVLVMNQYAVELDWSKLWKKTVQALPGKSPILFVVVVVLTF